MKLQKENPYWHEDIVGPVYSKGHPRTRGVGMTWKHCGNAETRAWPRPKKYKSAFQQDL